MDFYPIQNNIQNLNLNFNVGSSGDQKALEIMGINMSPSNSSAKNVKAKFGSVGGQEM